MRQSPQKCTEQFGYFLFIDFIETADGAAGLVDFVHTCDVSAGILSRIRPGRGILICGKIARLEGIVAGHSGWCSTEDRQNCCSVAELVPS